MAVLTRRELLARSGSLLVGSGLLGAAACTGTLSPYPSVHRRTLDCRWIDAKLDGTRCRLRTYNGSVPGPAIVVRPGDLLHVTVRNRLTPYDSSRWSGDHNVPHMLDTTNLHLHGLEIVPHLFDPVGTSDPAAEMIAIGPGESRDYVLQIPDDQPPGLFWYHPHHHGSTAVQAVSGMAGGLIIRGDIDEAPEIKAARDLVIVFQDIGLFPGEADPDTWLYEPRQNAIWNTLQSSVMLDGQPADLQGGFTTGDYKRRFYLVNGKPVYREDHNYDLEHTTEPIGTQLGVPRYRMRPGEVVRFRLLNGNSDDLMPIVVEGHELFLLALDGVNFVEPRVIPVKGIDGRYGDQQLLLAPANRAEFLLKANRMPGIYRIVQLEQSEQFLKSDRRVLAEIEIAGSPLDMGLPESLPTPSRHYPLIKESEIVRRRELVFSMNAPAKINKTVGLDFLINGTLYDEQEVNATAELDTAEEWTISVPDEARGGSEGHPFHIHVNSFEVVSMAGVPQPPGTIMDTLWIDKNSSSVIRMQFRQWTGKSVYHCHILPHEDTGMMQNLLIRG